MTREEADKLLQNCSLDVDGYYWTDVEDILMKLSDDFESHTCESCKYNSKAHVIFENSCILLGMMEGSMPTPDSFGCNKWEAKDAK